MKNSIKNFKKQLRTELGQLLEDLDRERRANHGHGLDDEGAGVTYGDLPEALELEDLELEDTDRLRRMADRYGETAFEEGMEEEGSLPPNAEKLAKALKSVPGVGNPFALAQWMHQQGMKKHEAMPSLSSVAERKKKKKKAKSHAAPSGGDHFPGPPSGDGGGE